MYVFLLDNKTHGQTKVKNRVSGGYPTPNWGPFKAKNISTKKEKIIYTYMYIVLLFFFDRGSSLNSL
jgi:hypothetical protein